MRQRNDTGYEQHVSVWPDEDHPDRHPFSVADGEETGHPDPIGGFTILEEPAEAADVAKPKRKEAAVAVEQEGGEPQ